RTGRWTKMHRPFVPFSVPESSTRTRSLVDCITTTFGFRFSVQTAVAGLGGALNVEAISLQSSSRYLRSVLPPTSSFSTRVFPCRPAHTNDGVAFLERPI